MMLDGDEWKMAWYNYTVQIVQRFAMFGNLKIETRHSPRHWLQRSLLAIIPCLLMHDKYALAESSEAAFRLQCQLGIVEGGRSLHRILRVCKCWDFLVLTGWSFWLYMIYIFLCLSCSSDWLTAVKMLVTKHPSTQASTQSRLRSICRRTCWNPKGGEVPLGKIRKLQMTVRGARSNLFSKTAGILGAKCTIRYYPLLSITIRILQEIASTMWMSTPFFQLAFGIQPAFEEQSTCFGLVTVQRVCIVPCHRTGWWEILQESPIFDGKNHGFL